MTNQDIKKKAQKIWIERTGIKIGLKSIVLLEADMDGKYIFFRVGKLAVGYFNRLGQEQVAMYPDSKGINGMNI